MARSRLSKEPNGWREKVLPLQYKDTESNGRLWAARGVGGNRGNEGGVGVLRQRIIKMLGVKLMRYKNAEGNVWGVKTKSVSEKGKRPGDTNRNGAFEFQRFDLREIKGDGTWVRSACRRWGCTI